MVRNLLCVLLLCDIALCPALCAWQCDCNCTTTTVAACSPSELTCPHCQQTPKEPESPSQPLHPNCCKSCICKGAVVGSNIQIELDQQSYYVSLTWFALPVTGASDLSDVMGFADTPPPFESGGRFVRIWNCSWLC